MNGYRIGAAAGFADRSKIVVDAGGRPVAVFRIGDAFYAVNNVCPHKGASLCDGALDAERPIVYCPWHKWGWHLDTGALDALPAERIRRYDVKVEDGQVVVYA